MNIDDFDAEHRAAWTAMVAALKAADPEHKEAILRAMVAWAHKAADSYYQAGGRWRSFRKAA
jgi:hypothetical protein